MADTKALSSITNASAAKADSLAELPGFAARALLEAVKDESWLPLCDKLHVGIRSQIADMKVGKRFCELSEKEQVALVEKNWKDLQQKDDSPMLDVFAARMSREVDEELLKMLLDKANKTPVKKNSKMEVFTADAETEQANSDTHPTNVAALVLEISAAAIDMLECGPANLMNSTKLFINRPLPASLRPYIWSRSLYLTNSPATRQNMSFGRLAPSLDLILSRRCHALLDTKFPRLSSRANAAYAKTVASNFVRLIGVTLPVNSYDSLTDMDHALFLVVPLIVLFRSDFGKKKHTADVGGDAAGEVALDADGNEIAEVQFSDDIPTANKMFKNTNSNKYIIENALYSLLEPRNLGSLRVSSGTMSFVDKAPGIDRTKTLLATKDSELYFKLWGLKSTKQSGDRNSEDDFTTETTTFEAFFSEQLIRGLSGLLNLETCMFCWDQGFIKDFGGILPLVLVTLVLGNASELKGLTSFHSIIETFTSYCQAITIEQLQSLLSSTFPQELGDFFDIPGNYRFKRGDDGILQAVYKRLGGGK
mgnify:CR=1 FL=1